MAMFNRFLYVYQAGSCVLCQLLNNGIYGKIPWKVADEIHQWE